MKKYLVIDIGGTAIKYAFMNEAGEFLEKGETPTPYESFEAIINAIDSFAVKYKDEISGIAMSAPGRIDVQKGYFHTGGALSKYLNGQYMGSVLSEKYGVPVTVDNDAKCAANAELWLGALKGYNSGVILVLGTGIGGGIVLDSKVWRGMHGCSGEVSNLPTTYETFGGDTLWAQKNGVYGLLRPYAALKGIDVKETNGRKYFDALKAGDEDAKVVFDKFIHNLVMGIVNIQITLDVEKFCIGGGISAQDILIDSLRDAIKDFFATHPGLPVIEPEIDRCQFNNDANLIGALKTFYDVYGK